MAWHETSVSKMYIICHYWYFLDRGFKFQLSVCNDCHDVSMMSIDINNIAILNFLVVVIIVILLELPRVKP